MPFSDYKSQRRDAHGGREKKATNGREQERVTKETGMKRNTKKKNRGWAERDEKKTGRRTGKGQGNEQDRGEQIFCPCFFSKKQRLSCLTIVRHEHGKKGHSLAL